MHVQPFGHGSHLQNPISVLPSPLPPTPPSFSPPHLLLFAKEGEKKNPSRQKKSSLFCFWPTAGFPKNPVLGRGD